MARCVIFANLRAGFRWAQQRGSIETAATLASYGVALGLIAQNLEPTGWAEELVDAAVAADINALPRLYAAASACTFTGRPGDALTYATLARTVCANPADRSSLRNWTRLGSARQPLLGPGRQRSARLYGASSAELVRLDGRRGEIPTAEDADVFVAGSRDVSSGQARWISR